MERDAQQKDTLCEKLWLMRFLPQPNAKCFSARAIEERRREMTDIDVLAVRMDDLFRPQYIAVDCKTGNTSPINRAIWLSGLMATRGVSSGFVIARRHVPIDHRSAALPWGITILEENEVDDYFRLACGVERVTLRCLRTQSWDRFWKDMPSTNALEGLLDYLEYGYWGDLPERALRYTLMEARACRSAFSPDQRLHHALAAECAALFSVAFLQVVSSVLPVHLVVTEKNKLAALVKARIYGGRDVYAYLERMRRSVIDAGRAQGSPFPNGGQPPELALPEWDRFLSMFRASLEQPREFRDVGRVLRLIAFDRILFDEPVDLRLAVPSASLRTVQLAADVAGYFCAAAALHPDFISRIRQECDAFIVALSADAK